MSGNTVEIDVADLKAFFGRVESAAKGDFRKEFELFLEGFGNEFLRILQDEIVRRKVVHCVERFVKIGVFEQL